MSTYLALPALYHTLPKYRSLIKVAIITGDDNRGIIK